MIKERHLKTIPEKYGIQDKTIDVEHFIQKYRKNQNSKWLFDNIPYVGIIYYSGIIF